MTTISELQQLAVDLEYRIQKECADSDSDLSSLREHIDAVRSQVENVMGSLNTLTDAVEKVFAGRRDALVATIGSTPTASANEA